jgi:ATP-dependent helicase/nuclease subunit A
VLRADSLRPVTATDARAARIPPPLPAIPPAGQARPIPSPKQPPPALSYTSLSEIERCGYRYYLERQLGLPEDPSALPGRSGLEGRRRGVLVHRLLQSVDFADPRPPGERDLGRIARESGIALAARERLELSELLRAALDAPLARRLAAAPLLHRERSFAFSLAPAEPLLTGVLDLFAPGPAGDCLVVDYKSDRLPAEEDLEAVVVRDYGAQRLIYALAALHDGAERVEVVHWFLERPHEPVTAVFRRADLPALARELRERADRARARGYAPSPAPHRHLCLTCPGRATLCSWDSSVTLRPSPSPAPASARART